MQLQLEVAQLNRCVYMECKIEVITKDEFQTLLKDEPTYREEAGCLIECWNSEQKKLIHDYFPVGNNLNAIETWESTYLDGLEGNETLDYRNTIYWHTKVMAKITIYRDERWFSRCRDEVKEFWDDVLEGREKLECSQTDKVPDNIDSEPVVEKASKVRKPKTKKVVCLIQDNSESD